MKQVSDLKSRLSLGHASNRGQIVVEYVLLLVVGVAMGVILLNSLAKKDPDNPGVLIKKWEEIRCFIATDDQSKCPQKPQ